jgi:hypothetical protein
MHFLRESPRIPAPRPPRAQQTSIYQPLIDALMEKPTEWLAINLDEMDGDSPELKRGRIVSSLYQKNVRVKTRLQNGKLYLLPIQKTQKKAQQ